VHKGNTPFRHELVQSFIAKQCSNAAAASTPSTWTARRYTKSGNLLLGNFPSSVKRNVSGSTQTLVLFLKSDLTERFSQNVDALVPKNVGDQQSRAGTSVFLARKTSLSQTHLPPA
jgi:hypothetical protein